MSGIENIQNTQFIGSTPKKTVEIKTEDKKEKPKFDNKKIIGALVGLGAVAAAGVAIASKIRKGKTVDTDFIETSIRPNNFDNMDIDEFRKIGCFKKGETFVGDSPYTGIINVKNKKDIFVLEYKNGKLVESAKYSTDFPQPMVSKKIYSTSEDGAKTIQRFKISPNNEEEFISKTKITPDEIKTTTIEDGIELSHGAFKKEIKFKDKSINIWQPYEEVIETTPSYRMSELWELPALRLKSKYPKIRTVDPRKPSVKIAEPRYARYATGKSEPLIRKTENGVTYINGNKVATRKQRIDSQGNKIITVDYGTPTKKTITITPEGKRIVDYIN